MTDTTPTAVVDNLVQVTNVGGNPVSLRLRAGHFIAIEPGKSSIVTADLLSACAGTPGTEGSERQREYERAKNKWLGQPPQLLWTDLDGNEISTPLYDLENKLGKPAGLEAQEAETVLLQRELARMRQRQDQLEQKLQAAERGAEAQVEATTAVDHTIDQVEQFESRGDVDVPVEEADQTDLDTGDVGSGDEEADGDAAGPESDDSASDYDPNGAADYLADVASDETDSDIPVDGE